MRINNRYFLFFPILALFVAFATKSTIDAERKERKIQIEKAVEEFNEKLQNYVLTKAGNIKGMGYDKLAEINPVSFYRAFSEIYNIWFFDKDLQNLLRGTNLGFVFDLVKSYKKGPLDPLREDEVREILQNYILNRNSFTDYKLDPKEFERAYKRSLEENRDRFKLLNALLGNRKGYLKGYRGHNGPDGTRLRGTGGTHRVPEGTHRGPKGKGLIFPGGAGHRNR